MAGDSPIAEAFVELLPQTDEAKFEAALNKIGDILGAKIAGSFNKTTTAADKATSATNKLGTAGQRAGAKTASGADKGTASIHKMESAAHRAEGTFKRIAVRITEAFSIYEVARFVKESVEVEAAYERVNRVVVQALKTTGNAAGITIKQFDDLSSKMALSTGIAETSIMKANQQLLAFTNIRNIAGKGNDIFNRAAGAIQDIGVRTGLGTVSVARSLGKALEDPAKATLVLRRASIILTAQQNKQIDTFKKSNNVLGAQKVILDAIEQKFGGAAAAASDPMKQLTVAVNQIQRSLGEALLPTVDKFAETVIHHVPQIKEFAETVGKVLQAAIKAATPALRALGKAIEYVAGNKNVQDVLKGVAIGLGALLVAHEVTKSINDLKGAIKLLIAQPEVAIVIGLGIAFYELYKHSETFRNGINRLGDYVQQHFAPVMSSVSRIFHEDVVPALKVAGDYFMQHILPILKKVGEFVGTYIVVEFRLLVAFIKDLLVPILKVLWSIFSVTILPVLKQIWEVLNNYVVPAFSWLVHVLEKTVVPAIKGFADFVLSALKSVIGVAGKVAGALGFHGLADSLKSLADGIGKFKTDLDNIAANPIVFHVQVKTDFVKGVIGQAVTSGDNPLKTGQTGAIAKAVGGAIDKVTPKPTGPTVAPPPQAFPSDGTTKKKKAKIHANMVEIVRDTIFALNDGLKKGSEAASKTVSSLEQKIRSSLKGTLDEKLTSSALAFIEKQRKGLVTLAGAYTNISTAIKNLKTHLATLVTQLNDFKKSVIDALQSTSSIDAYLSGKISGGSVHSFEHFLQKQVDKMKKFRDALSTLLARGVDSTFVQTLAAGGLANARFAEKLAKSPAGDLAKVASLQTSLASIQKSVADTASKKLQDAVDRTNIQLSRELQTQAKILTSINGLAHKIVTGLAGILGVKNIPKFGRGGYSDGPSIFGEDGRELALSLKPRDRQRSLNLLAQSPFGVGAVGRSVHAPVTVYAAPGMDEVSLAHRLSTKIAQQVR